jgi:hypothetical protein
MTVMRLLLSILTLSALLLPSTAAAQGSPFDTVVAFFTALSEASHQGIRDSTTENFLVLEHGEVWNLDKLLSVVRPKTTLRRNFFSVVSEDVRGDTALVNYWNKALERSENGEERTRAWLESVVIIKRRGAWRLLQMHSTRLTTEQIPQNVAFTERR